MKSFKQTIDKIFEHKAFKTLFISFGIFVVLLIVFQFGMVVGFHKATYGKDWNDHYMENFGPHHGPLGNMPDHIPGGHGTFGKIASINLPQLIISDRDATEKTILITGDTKIREFRNDILPTDLTPDMTIVAIGEPNDQGQIVAKLIRILPIASVLTHTVSASK
jgi:hypothetical protein